MLRRSQMGIGLLELMLSLTVIAVLLVVATRYYDSVRTNYRVHEGLGMIYVLHSAAESWLHNNPDVDEVDITKLINNNSIPKNFNQNNANPWGGNIVIGGKEQVITIEMSNVPETDCNNLKEKLVQKMGAFVTDETVICASKNNTLTIELNLASQ